MKAVIILIVGVAGTVVLSVLVDKPAAYVFGLWSLLSAGLFVVMSRRGRWLLYNLVIVWGMCAAAELYLGRGNLKDWQLVTKTIPNKPNHFVAGLGYVPRPNIVVRWERHMLRDNGERISIFNMQYTINEHGLRITPKLDRPAEKCVLFFGGSFTFGAGLADEEVAAYQIAERSDGRVRTYNFGLGGRGPHYMLAQIESGLVKRAVECSPTHAIYQALPGHVARVGRLRSWTLDDPAYWMEKGKPRFFGLTEESFPRSVRFKRTLYSVVRSSQLAQRLLPSTLLLSDEHRLTAAVIEASERALRAMNPDIKFILIAWDQSPGDTSNGDLDHLLHLLPSSVEVHRITNILLDYQRHKYTLSKYDRHPNALANHEIASYVLDRIVTLP